MKIKLFTKFRDQNSILPKTLSHATRVSATSNILKPNPNKKLKCPSNYSQVVEQVP